MANLYQTNIQIGGAVDPSLYKAVGLSAKQMALLQKHIQGFNSLAKQSQLSLNGIPPSLQRANAQITQMHQGFMTMGRLIPKIVIGDLIASGIRMGVRAMDDLIGRVRDFASESLKIRGQFEKSEWALSNILGSKALGARLQSQLNKLGATQFGGIELGDVAQKLSAVGVPTQNLLGTTKMLADIGAASGGGKESMEALLSGYIRTHDSGFMQARGLQQLAHAGIPMEQVLVQLYGKGALTVRDSKGNPKQIIEEGLPKIQYMMKHQLVTAKMFDEALKAMVSAGGFAADGMKRHAEIWEGAVEQITQQWKLLQDNLGEVEERIFTPLLVWFNNSGIWQYAKTWIDEARTYADGAISYFKSNPIGDKLEVIFKPIQIWWARFNAWIDSFFVTFTNPATGDIQKALKPSTESSFQHLLDKLEEFSTKILTINKSLDDFSARIDPVVKFFSWLVKLLGDIDDIIYGKLVPFLAGNMGVGILKGLVLPPQHAPDSYKMNPNAFPDSPEMRQYLESHKQNTSSVNDNTDALNRLADSLMPANPSAPNFGGNYGLHGALSDEDNRVYYEHDYEGHSSQYGPKGNRLGDGYGIGLGVAKQNQIGAHFGDWVKVRLSNGKTVVRRINETSARPHGVEFHSPGSDESSYGERVQSIEKVPGPTSSVTNHFHVYAMDSTGVDAVLREHGEKFYRNHLYHHGNDMSRTAAV